MLGINPVYRIRPDGGRTLVVNYVSYSDLEPKFMLMYPLAGVVMAMIDGSESYDSLIQNMSSVLDVGDEKAEQYLCQICQRVEEMGEAPLIVEGDRIELPRRAFTPEEFIVDKACVDLQSLKLQAPTDILLIVTNRCQCRCLYCYAERDKSRIPETLSLSRVLELVDEAAAIGVYEIQFSGGDPMQWPHIIPTVRRMVEVGVTPFISTKKFLSEATCKGLAESGLAFMQYSLDSPVEDTADFLVGQEGFYKKALASIENLVAAGINTKIKAVVTPYNAPEVGALIELGSQVGASEVHLVPYGRSAFRHSEDLFLSDDTSKAIRQTVLASEKKYPFLKITGFGAPSQKSKPSKKALNLDVIPIRPDSPQERWLSGSRTICSMGRTGLTILPDGSVLMCEQLPSEPRFIVGSVANNSIMDVWRSSEFTQRTLYPDRALFRGSACSICDDFDWCHEIKGRCIREAFKAYGDPYQPEPSCPRAPAAPRLA